MKLQFIVVFIFILQILVVLPLNAQTAPPSVEKSSEKILYKGKVYYMHIVKKGQTLYAICRAYNATTQDVTNANPGISLSPLSEGQVLRIPAPEKSEQKFETSTDQIKEDFIYHKVQSKETPYSLHLKYNISVEDIYKYNTGADRGLQVGQIVKIPQLNTAQSRKKEVLVKTSNSTYVIKQGDTLYNIAKSFKVSVSDLINANEALRWGLKPGQIIKIPENFNNRSIQPEINVDTSLSANNLPKLSDTECDSIAASRSKIKVNIAVVLPFHATEVFRPDSLLLNDSIDDNDIRLKNTAFKGTGAVEFYEGILLAMDSLKKTGADINLYVYDDEADTNKMKQIIFDFDSIRPDLIIGPFNNDNVKIVSDYSRRTATLFVPPLMKDDSVVRLNPNLFQPTPSSETEMKSSIDYLSQYKGQNIILVYEPGLIRQEAMNQFKVLLKRRLSFDTIPDSVVFHEVFIGESMQQKIKSALRSDLKNIVVVVSTQEPDVSNVLTQLYTYNRYYEIIVFGLPAWQKFKNVRIDYFHDLEVLLFTPFFIDYNDESVKSFVRTCRAKLGYEPYKTLTKGTGMNYTFFGYDLGFFFYNVIKNYGKNAILCAEKYHPKLLLTNYKFQPNLLNGCWENIHLNLIQYKKDYSIEKIDY